MWIAFVQQITAGTTIMSSMWIGLEVYVCATVFTAFLGASSLLGSFMLPGAPATSSPSPCAFLLSGAPATSSPSPGAELLSGHADCMLLVKIIPRRCCAGSQYPCPGRWEGVCRVSPGGNVSSPSHRRRRGLSGNLGLFEALVVQQVDRSGDLRKECDPHVRAGAVIGEPVPGCVPVVQIE
jgi:hypothetical protein